MEDPINLQIVDDDEHQLGLIEIILNREFDERETEVEITKHNNPLEALDYIEEAQWEPEVEFIVSDYKMPQLNGLKFLERAKALRDDSNIPAILHTSQGAEEVAGEAANLGAGYFQKPLSNPVNDPRDIYPRMVNYMEESVRKRRQERRINQTSELIENFPEAIYHISSEYTILEVNKAARAAIGLEDDQILEGEDMDVFTEYGFMTQEQIDYYKNERHPEIIEAEGAVEWTAEWKTPDGETEEYRYRAQSTPSEGVVGIVEKVDDP